MRTQSPAKSDTVTITALSHDGRGIARCHGKTVFVDGALPGETVRFSYLRRHAKFDEGSFISIAEIVGDAAIDVAAVPASPITQSSLRVLPRCPHFGVCGGCSLQHLKHEEQLALKERVLLEQLSHIGGINVPASNILPPLTGPIWNYRSKARFSVKYVVKKGRVLLGFHEKNGRFVMDGMQSCPILHAALSDKIEVLRELIASLSCYQAIPQVEVACGNDSGIDGQQDGAAKGSDVSGGGAALIIRHLQPLLADDIAKLCSFAAQHCLRIFLQPQGLDSVHCITHATNFLHYTLYGSVGVDDGNEKKQLTLRFLPTDFTQINHVLNQKMVARVIDLLDLQPEDTVLDLFCGIGNFTLPIALHCQHIVGVEGSVSAVERARENASGNGVGNVSFYSGDLSYEEQVAGDESSSGSNIAKPTPEWAKSSYTKIVLDPPRVGALGCIRYLAAQGLIGQVQRKSKKSKVSKVSLSSSQQQLPLTPVPARTIVYVSCNPATLARDAKEIVQLGYTLVATGIMDMFPHTSHVESIAVFRIE